MTRGEALAEAAAIIAKAVPDLAYLAELLEHAGLRRLADGLGTRPPAVRPRLDDDEILEMWRTGKIR
jgi:hypothetical protein